MRISVFLIFLCQKKHVFFPFFQPLFQALVDFLSFFSSLGGVETTTEFHLLPPGTGAIPEPKEW
jgi:hypothetical protein